MILAARLRKLLDANMVVYSVLQHKRVDRLDQAAHLLSIDPAKVLTAQVLQDNLGRLLVVHRLSTKIDIPKLQKLLNRNLTVVATNKVNRLFDDCDAKCWPPIGQVYSLDTLIDESIEQYETLYFSSGSSAALVQISLNDYLHLNSRAKLLDFSEDVQLSVAAADQLKSEDANQLKDLSLPPLPSVAVQILELSMANDFSPEKLAEILSKDKTLQQQILLYHQMPLVKGNMEDPGDIIEHMLGFNKISHIALGVAASQAFARRGADWGYAPEFWRHAFCAATYSERISKLVAEKLNLDPALSYLAGLFHNFGLLLFSELFAPEFSILKKWVALNPKISIAVLEKKLLGLGRAFNVVRGGHAQLGERLLRHWNMPELICVVAKEHHSLTYGGKYQAYVKIIQLTNQLLREEGIGDGSLSGINPHLLESLDLTEQQVRDVVKDINSDSVSLEYMTNFLNNK